MKNVWNLAASNLRKNKGQTLSFFVMILLASMLLNIGLVVWFNYDKNYDRRAEELNSADVMFVMQNTKSGLNELQEEISKDERISVMENVSVLYLAGSCQFGSGKTSRRFVIFPSFGDHEIEQLSYVEKDEAIPNPIYLPYTFKTGGGYDMRDTFLLHIASLDKPEQKFSFTIAGFYEETLAGTINSSTTSIVLDEKEYKQIADHYQGSLNSQMLLIQLKDSALNEIFATEYAAKLPNDILSDGIFYDMVKQARVITSSIGSMIIVAFSIVVVIVCLVVIKFRITSSIEEEMHNIGALKAMGYTSKQIIGTFLLQFLSAGAVGTVAGMISSYLVLPFVSTMFAIQTGVVWKQGFDLLSAVITITSILSAVALVALLSACKVKKLHPIIALRSGIMTHNFKHNFMPLDTTRGSLNVSLSGKIFLQNIRQYIMVGFITGMVSFAALFGVILYYNMAVKSENFINLAGGECADVQLDGMSEKDTLNLLPEILKMPEVDEAFYTATNYAQSMDGTQIICYVAEDFSKYKNQSMLYKGRFPKYENEVALGGLLAGQLNKKPGDKLEIQKDGVKSEFLITGLLQSSNFLGHDAALTDQGYQRLAKDYRPVTISVYLKERKAEDLFIKKVKNLYQDQIAIAINRTELLEASLGVYKNIVTILVFVIFFVIAAIIALTLYLVIKMALIRRRRELGIKKSIGYTTGQMITQTAFSLLLAVVPGTVIGCCAGYFGINPLLSALFSVIGIMKVNFANPVSILIGLCAGLTLFAFLISILLSLKIRKISPYSLMGE